MTGWDWFGLITFVIILMLLFFAAFGGTNITDESIEEYMKRLMQNDKEGKIKLWECRECGGIWSNKTN